MMRAASDGVEVFSRSSAEALLSIITRLSAVFSTRMLPSMALTFSIPTSSMSMLVAVLSLSVIIRTQRSPTLSSELPSPKCCATPLPATCIAAATGSRSVREIFPASAWRKTSIKMGILMELACGKTSSWFFPSHSPVVRSIAAYPTMPCSPVDQALDVGESLLPEKGSVILRACPIGREQQHQNERTLDRSSHGRSAVGYHSRPGTRECRAGQAKS